MSDNLGSTAAATATASAENLTAAAVAFDCVQLSTVAEQASPSENLTDTNRAEPRDAAEEMTQKLEVPDLDGGHFVPIDCSSNKQTMSGVSSIELADQQPNTTTSVVVVSAALTLDSHAGEAIEKNTEMVTKDFEDTDNVVVGNSDSNATSTEIIQPAATLHSLSVLQDGRSQYHSILQLSAPAAAPVIIPSTVSSDAYPAVYKSSKEGRPGSDITTSHSPIVYDYSLGRLPNPVGTSWPTSTGGGLYSLGGREGSVGYVHLRDIQDGDSLKLLRGIAHGRKKNVLQRGGIEGKEENDHYGNGEEPNEEDGDDDDDVSISNEEDENKPVDMSGYDRYMAVNNSAGHDDDSNFSMTRSMSDDVSVTSSRGDDMSDDDGDNDGIDLRINGRRSDQWNGGDIETAAGRMSRSEQKSAGGRRGFCGDLKSSTTSGGGGPRLNQSTGSNSDDPCSSLDDVIEAKRARMEAIVTNMRVSPSSRGNKTINGGATGCASNNDVTGRRGADVRRPKRKQYTPKQHDVKAAEDAGSVGDDIDVVMTSESDGDDEDEDVCIRAGDGGGVALQEELRHMQEQLTDMKEKYSKLVQAGVMSADGKSPFDYRYSDGLERMFDIERRRELSLRFQETACNLVGHQLSQRLLMSHAAAKGLSGASGVQPQQTSPLGGDTPADVEHLAVMLKAEIASGVGTLVDEIVKNFVEKHKLNIDFPLTPSKPDSVQPMSLKVNGPVTITANEPREEASTERERPAAGSTGGRGLPGVTAHVKKERSIVSPPVILPAHRDQPHGAKKRHHASACVVSSPPSAFLDSSRPAPCTASAMTSPVLLSPQGVLRPPPPPLPLAQMLAAGASSFVDYSALVNRFGLHPMMKPTMNNNNNINNNNNNNSENNNDKSSYGRQQFFDQSAAAAAAAAAHRHFKSMTSPFEHVITSRSLFNPHPFFASMHHASSVPGVGLMGCPPGGSAALMGCMSSASMAAAAVAATGSGGGGGSGNMSSFVANKEPEQTEALPLVVNAPMTKKKRTKVTDTRLSPRAARAMLQDSLVTPGSAAGGSNQRSNTGQTVEHRSFSRHGSDDERFVDVTPSNRSSTNDLNLLHRRNHHRSSSPHLHPHQSHSRHHHAQRSHRNVHGGRAEDGGGLLPASLPTSVAVPNPGLQNSDVIKAIYNRQRELQQVDLSRRYVTTSDSPIRSASCGSSPDGAAEGRGREEERGGGETGRSGGGSGGSTSDGYPPTSNYRHQVADSSLNGDNSYELFTYNSDDQAITSTLTPMHLRKAKLMFFYVRYPSSAIIKLFFPDVKFNKNNTAQLIKWFSNFREFYYIQMEKYARQALAEGLKNALDIVVTTDSEIYRVLVLHYNRNNQIEVPDNFRHTVQATLREFFKSIQADKDQEPSWKKAIYKIIARLDDNVPEYFKSSNWMERLADG